MTQMVTVLMTTYNGMSYLEECINSVLSQNYKDFEFLIIDDASTDGTSEYISNIKDSRINFYQNKVNIGQTASLNRGLKISKGDFIVRVDQDDVCLSGRIGEQLTYMAKHKNVSIACSWEYSINGAGKVTRIWKREITNRGDFVGYIVLGLCPVWHPSVIFRKSVIMKLGGYDTSYGPAEDYHLWSKIAGSGFNASIIQKFHLLQRNHGESQSVKSAYSQKFATLKAQKEFINRFIQNEGQGTENFLKVVRLETDIKLKNIVIESAQKLEKLLCSISSSLNFTESEKKSLQLRVLRRVGLGFYASKYMSEIPSVVFMLVFYILSPMYIPMFLKFIKNVINLKK